MSSKKSRIEMRFKQGIDRDILMPKTVRGTYRYNYQAVSEYLKDLGVTIFKDRIYMYTGYGYVEISKKELKEYVVRMLSHHHDVSDLNICPFLTQNFNELYSRLDALWICHPFDPEEVKKDARYRGYLVSFRNGLYNVTTDELLPHTPKAFVMERFDFDYDPSVTDDPIRESYKGIIKGQDYDIFFTALGRTFFSRSSPTFAVVIHGEYGSGMSFLYDSVNILCVEDSFSYLMGNEIGQNYVPAYLLDKVANLTCFASFSRNKFSVDLRSLDGLIRGSSIRSNRKYEPKSIINNSTPLWFMVEGTFDTESFSEGLALRTYSVNCKFDQSTMPSLYSLSDRFESARPRQWVVNEALRMFRKYGLTPFDHVFKNSLDLYLEKIGDTTDVIEHLDGMKVTEAYEEYVNDLRLGQSPLAKSQFLNHIKSQYGLGTRHKSIRIGDKVTSINVFCKTD